MIRIGPLPLLFFAFLFFQGLTAASQTVHSHYLDGVLYARQDPASSLQLDPYLGGHAYLDSLITEHGIDSIDASLTNLPSWHRIEFSDITEVDQLLQALQLSSVFDTAHKMPYFETSYDPNDPLYSQQWHLMKVNVPNAWDTTQGDSSVSIAVVDNAVSTQHEDLVSELWTNEDEVGGNGLDDDLNGYTDDVHGYDVADGDGNPNPPSGGNFAWVHGTHVAGISGAATDNGKGVASLGFGVELIAVKCSPNSSNGGTLTNAYEGVDYAIEAGANIINMSFGSYSNGMVGDLLIQKADDQGISLVAAAGNDDSTGVIYPAGYSNVVSVGATNSNDEKASFSNYGSWIDLMAPGVQIESSLSTGTGQYGALNGTSMASPLVSGVAGLLLSVDNGLTPEQVRSYLEDGCVDIAAQNPSYDGQLGAGRIDASLAVQDALGLRGGPEKTDLQLYPRPSDGTVTLSGVPEGVREYRLIGVSGRVFRTGIVQGSVERFSFDVPSGLYLLQLQGKDDARTLKLTITEQ